MPSGSRAATREKAVGEEPPEDLPHQFVVAPPAALDRQRRLPVEGVAHGHVALHEADQFVVAQAAQAGALLPSVGAQAPAICAAVRHR